jgi:hypothetical protein
MAKLGEQISTGAWIYALGNSLRIEFRECKDGILYNKDGFHTVMSVKTKLLSEEAVPTSQTKKASQASLSRTSTDDEIALVSKKTKDKKQSTTKTPQAATSEATEETSSDKALWLKGKGGKGNPTGKGQSKGKNRWHAPDQQWNDAWDQWSQPAKGKGRGKGNGSTEPLWCDICQRQGHSTDWCSDNPNWSGGKPLYDELWCETCNRSGHTSISCFATSIEIIPKGKGKSKGKTGKSGNRG